MDFKVLQKGIIQNAVNYGRNYNVKIDENFALLKLYEEVGELSQAILIHNKKCRPDKYLAGERSKKAIEGELADVLGMIIINAHLLDIDLEKALREKWINKEK